MKTQPTVIKTGIIGHQRRTVPYVSLVFEYFGSLPLS